MSRDIKEKLLHWYLTHVYGERNYGIEIKDYNLVIITGKYPDEESIPPFTIEVLENTDRGDVIVVDVRPPDIKNDFNIHDDLLTNLTVRGKGKLKINIAKLISSVRNKSLPIKELLKVYKGVFTNALRTNLSLDGLDIVYYETFFELTYLKNVYDEAYAIDMMETLEVGKFLPGFNKEIGVSFIQAVEDPFILITEYTEQFELSRRAKLDERLLREIIMSLVPTDLRDYLERGVTNIGFFAGLLLEISTNLFYKKSKFGMFLNDRGKILKINQLIDDIEYEVNF